MDNAAEKPSKNSDYTQADADSVGGNNANHGVNLALQSYLRELGQLPRLTAEEQAELGRKILTAENRWRELLTAFAATAQWQTDFLNLREKTLWHEQFIPSSGISENDTEKLQLFLEKCEKIANQLLESFHRGDRAECEQLRSKLVQEMSLYKLSSDILMQYHKQLEIAAETLPDIALQILASESAFTLQEFRNNLRAAEEARNKLLDLRQQMVEGNLRLVIRIVNQYSYRQLSIGDLVQEGNLGLMRSLEKFDFNLKHKFSTYASWWIRQSIGRAIAEQFRVIRIPSHMISTIAAINRVEQRFILEHDRMPEVSEIAAILEMPPARVSAIRKMARQTISLQSPLTTDESGSNLEDVLPDMQSQDPSCCVSEETINHQLLELLKTLSGRERMILSMRFGLLGQRVHTLREISNHFNISRERVRQLEMQTLNKLRTPENLRLLGAHRP